MGPGQGLRHVLSSGPGGSHRARLARARSDRAGERRAAAARARNRHALSDSVSGIVHQCHHDARAGRSHRDRHTFGRRAAPRRRRRRGGDSRRWHSVQPGSRRHHLMIEFSQRLNALPGYPLAEIPTIKRRLIEAGVDVIDLGAGDNDTPPPAVTIEAMTAALRDPAYSKYGFQQGLPAFRQAASRWVERRFGLRFDPAGETLPLIGSKEGLSHLPFAVVNPGDVTIVPEPGYQAYIGGAILSGAEPYIAPLRPENDFLLDLEQVPEAILRRAKLVFANYPNNPTAAVAPLEYLERTVSICRRHGIL